MTGELVRLGGAGRAPSTSVGIDPFASFRPAFPTLNAVVQMKGVFNWFDRERRVTFDPQDEDRAADVLAAIPDEARLAEVKELFHSAEFNDAGEPFLHVAVGAMMAGEGVTNDSYRHAITDSIYRDDEVWNGYGPGFSCPVIVRAVRQARLLGRLPAPGEFITICIKNRKRFRQWRLEIDALVDLRYQARICLGQIDPSDENYIPI